MIWKHRSSLVPAFGGVLVNEDGLILLREPAGHFDGYVWTFPKGRQDPGEMPEETALREVLEETGYQAEIIAKLPGRFVGGTTVTEYFLMKPRGVPQPFDAEETASVQWVCPADAKRMIMQTGNKTGRRRDLEVLLEARRMTSTRFSQGAYLAP